MLPINLGFYFEEIKFISCVQFRAPLMASSPEPMDTTLFMRPHDPVASAKAAASSGLRPTGSPGGPSRAAAAASSPRTVSWAPEVEVREITPLDSSSESSSIGLPVEKL